MVGLGVVPSILGPAAEVISLQEQQPLKYSKAWKNMVKIELKLGWQSCPGGAAVRWGERASLDSGGLSAAGLGPGTWQWLLIPLSGLQRGPELSCAYQFMSLCRTPLGRGFPSVTSSSGLHEQDVPPPGAWRPQRRPHGLFP